MSLRNPGSRTPLHKEVIKDDSISVIQNTWIAVYTSTAPGTLKLIRIQHTNNESANKDVEVEITIDGVTYNFNDTVTHNTAGYLYIKDDYPADIGCLEGTAKPFDIEPLTVGTKFQVCSIRYRMVSAPGTDQVLQMFVHHDESSVK